MIEQKVPVAYLDFTGHNGSMLYGSFPYEFRGKVKVGDIVMLGDDGIPLEPYRVERIYDGRFAALYKKIDMKELISRYSIDRSEDDN